MSRCTTIMLYSLPQHDTTQILAHIGCDSFTIFLCCNSFTTFMCWSLSTLVALLDVEMTVSKGFGSGGGDEWAAPPPFAEDTVLALSIIAD